MRQEAASYLQQAVCVRSKENEQKKHEIQPNTKQNTPRNKSTAARRPRPPRDGVQWNTSHALAHTRALPPHISGLWKSASLVYTRVCILALLMLRRLCTFWCPILFSGQRSFSLPWYSYVSPGSGLSGGAWHWAFRQRMVSEDSTRTAAREASSAAASYSREQRAAACGVRHNVQTESIERKQNNEFVPIRTPENSAAPKHPRLKKHLFSSSSMMSTRIKQIWYLV